MEKADNKIKYCIYARKSSESDERQALSIEAQINELKDLAEREGIQVVAVEQESFSAKTPEARPVFNKLVEKIKNKNYDALIVWAPDRLSRNPIDAGKLVYLLDLGLLKEIKTPTQTLRNTPSDKFMFTLLCGQAKLDNDQKGINVKRGLKMKAEKGWYPCPAPMGYVNEKYAEKGFKRIFKDEERFPIVRKMWDVMLTGNYSVPQVWKIVNEEWRFRTKNDAKLSRALMYKMFYNPFYYGFFEYPQGSGNWYQGEHEPMVTREEFDRAQMLIKKRNSPCPKTKKGVFAFTGGLIRCGDCGSSITAEEKFKYQKNGNTHRYVYYHCTRRKNPNCTQGAIRDDELEKQIITFLGSVQIDQEYLDWAIEYLQEVNKREVNGRGSLMGSYRKSYDDITKKLDKLLEMRMAGEIEQEEYQEKKSALIKDKEYYKKLLENTDQRQNQWIELAEKTFNFCRYAKYWFENGTLEQKRAILSALGYNLTLNDKKLSISLHKPFELVKEGLQGAVYSVEMLEPPKILITKRQTVNSGAKSIALLPG